MSSLARVRRWTVLVLLALFIGLLVVYGVPAVAYRLSYAVANAKKRAAADVAREHLTGLDATSETFRLVVDAVSPAVVHIDAHRLFQRRSQPSSPLDDLLGGVQESPPRYFRQQGLGTGVIVDPSGYILTNYHVVEGAEPIDVRLADGRVYRAKMVGSGDKPTDLAVLKIEAADLLAVQWGDSDEASIGNWVLAIGHPFGLDQTVTAGIISAKGRRGIIGNLTYQDFLQTDAAINPGSSGGPLVNSRGQLIGVNTAIVGQSNLGIGFAIPSNLAREIYDRLIETGRIVRGWLGVAMQMELTPELAEQFGLDEPRGALITSVLPESPADRAGLLQGDVVVVLDGEEVEDANELRDKVAMLEVGAQVEMEVVREGERRTLEIEIGQRPDFALTPPGVSPLGLQVIDLTVKLADELGLPDEQGVLITNVVPGSVADRRGLKPGQVILEIGGRLITDVRDYQEAMREADLKKGVLLRFRGRGGAIRFEVLKEP